jgi:hypothetical protein
MKNALKLLIIMAILIPFLSGCKKDNETVSDLQIREIAWNYLDDQQKSTVIIDWKDAPVEMSAFDGIKAYAVTFNTAEDALLGPIIVYVSTSNRVVLGQAFRD